MKQIPLDIRLAEHAVFGSFHPGPNGLLVDRLQRFAAGTGGEVLWFWGSPGSGRTHLLQATVAAAHALGRRTAYLPLRVLQVHPPEALDGMGGFDLVAVDDLDAIAGRMGWERALLRLYEELLPAGCRLVATGSASPSRLAFALGDLGSRLAAGGVFRLEPLGETDCLRALQLRAQWLGLSLPDETGQYLLARAERRIAVLCRVLDQLDREALAARKRLTIPFVRSVLDASAS